MRKRKLQVINANSVQGYEGTTSGSVALRAGLPFFSRSLSHSCCLSVLPSLSPCQSPFPSTVLGVLMYPDRPLDLKAWTSVPSHYHLHSSCTPNCPSNLSWGSRISSCRKEPHGWTPPPKGSMDRTPWKPPLEWPGGDPYPNPGGGGGRPLGSGRQLPPPTNCWPEAPWGGGGGLKGGQMGGGGAPGGSVGGGGSRWGNLGCWGGRGGTGSPYLPLPSL